MNVGSSGIDTVNQPQCVISSNVHFHTEVPFVSLLGLVHLRIALAGIEVGSTLNYASSFEAKLVEKHQLRINSTVGDILFFHTRASSLGRLCPLLKDLRRRHLRDPELQSYQYHHRTS